MKLKAAFTQLTERYPLLGNKYFLTFFGFLIWLLFLDGNNLVLQYTERKELTELRKQRKYYQEQIKNTREKLEAINTSEQTLEQYARENYFMKKEGEEIWTLVDTTASEN
jgi:cell division protein DivIC